jgi:hypothetical protein
MLITPLDELFLAQVIQYYRPLPMKYCSPLSASREQVEMTVNVINHALIKKGSSVRLALEVQSKKSVLTTVVGLIIFTGTITRTIPVAISPGLVRIHGMPFYLAHERWAETLVPVILNEIEHLMAEKTGTRN